MFVEACAREAIARRLGVLPKNGSLPDINDDWVARLRKAFRDNHWNWPPAWG